MAVAMTDKVVAVLNRFFPKLFDDARLTQSATYRKKVSAAYNSTQKQAVDTLSEATVSAVLIDEKLVRDDEGRSGFGVRRRVYVIRAEDMPASFVEAQVQEDQLVVGGVAFKIVNASPVLDMFYVLEVEK